MKKNIFCAGKNASAITIILFMAGCGGGGGGGGVSPSPTPSQVSSTDAAPKPKPTPKPTPAPTPAPVPSPTPTYTRPRIAHAGGGYNGAIYTDSIDALDFNADSYELFELDFDWTSDGHLVCMHDWLNYAHMVFGQEFPIPPTFAEYEQLVNAEVNFKNCTAEQVMDWLDQHPGKKIVTDIKENNVSGLQYFADRYPDFADRIIPQIYQPAEYQQVKDMGYKDIIWTLYAYSGSASSVLANAQHMSLYAVTMPPFRVTKDFIHDLAVRGFATYTHRFNTEADLEKYQALGVTEIYTDWLLP